MPTDPLPSTDALAREAAVQLATVEVDGLIGVGEMADIITRTFAPRDEAVRELVKVAKWFAAKGNLTVPLFERIEHRDPLRAALARFDTTEENDDAD